MFLKFLFGMYLVLYVNRWEDSWYLFFGMKFSVFYVRGLIYDSLIIDYIGKYDNVRCLISD